MSSEPNTSLEDRSNQWAFVIVGYAVLAVAAAVRIAVIISESIHIQNRSSLRSHTRSTFAVSPRGNLPDADAMDAAGTPQRRLPRVR